MTQTNFNLKNHLPIMATAYAEANKHTPKEHIAILSDILHKAESGHKKFGADTGSVMNVLKTNYDSAKNSSPKYMEAMNSDFKNSDNENNFKKVISTFSGIMKGGIQRTPFKDAIAKPVGRKSSGKTTGTIR